MAISISEQYPGKTAGNTTAYPYGEPRNVDAPGDGKGTPWEAAIVKDDQGFKQAILKAANVVPSGQPDTADESQYLDAMKALFVSPLAAVMGASGSVTIPVISGGKPADLKILWGTFQTQSNETIMTPQFVNISGLKSELYFASLSEDGGHSSRLEYASFDWSRTTKDRLAVYSNYSGTCKYLVIGK